MVEKRDNASMAVVPSVFVHQGRITQSLATATNTLAPDVVHIRFDLGEDWSGARAVFFRVLLRDKASELPQLREVSRRVRGTVFKEVQPDELGLEAYFNFRSESEQAEMKEQSWA